MQSITTLSLMAFVGVLATKTATSPKPDEATTPITKTSITSDHRDIQNLTCNQGAHGKDGYLEYPTSPLENVKAYDSVFYGKVAAPIRKCRLGYCVGVKVTRTVKGTAKKNVLVRIPTLPESDCGQDLFAKKGESWLIFSNQGVSAKGTSYYQVDYDGPSIAGRTPKSTGLAELENRYHERRNKLDQAINDSLEPHKRKRL